MASWRGHEGFPLTVGTVMLITANIVYTIVDLRPMFKSIHGWQVTLLTSLVTPVVIYQDMAMEIMEMTSEENTPKKEWAASGVAQGVALLWIIVSWALRGAAAPLNGASALFSATVRNLCGICCQPGTHPEQSTRFADPRTCTYICTYLAAWRPY